MSADVRHRRCWSSVRFADRCACEVGHAAGSVRLSALAPCDCFWRRAAVHAAEYRKRLL